MLKEVIKVPQDKDFLEFMKERFKDVRNPWFYIDKATIDILAEKEKNAYFDIKGKFHIPYGNIIIDGYRFNDYCWYRINSVGTDYKAAADPDEIFFVAIR